MGFLRKIFCCSKHLNTVDAAGNTRTTEPPKLTGSAMVERVEIIGSHFTTQESTQNQTMLTVIARIYDRTNPEGKKGTKGSVTMISGNLLALIAALPQTNPNKKTVSQGSEVTTTKQPIKKSIPESFPPLSRRLEPIHREHETSPTTLRENSLRKRFQAVYPNKLSLGPLKTKGMPNNKPDTLQDASKQTRPSTKRPVLHAGGAKPN